MSVRLQWPATGLIAGTLIWYWHEAQYPGSVLGQVSLRLVASGPSYVRYKGRRLKNGQK